MCKTCGEENADRNAAFNIAYRALGYIYKVGVTVNIPITLASTDRSTMMTRETRKRLRPVVVHLTFRNLDDQVRYQDGIRIDSQDSRDHMAAEQDSDCGLLFDTVQKA